MRFHCARVWLWVLLRRLLAPLLAGWLGVLAPARCWAAESAPEPASSARALGAQGARAYEAGNYAEAVERFDQALALLPAPSLGLWAARACAKLGRLTAAVQRYQQVARLSDQIGDPAVQRKAQLEARQELAALTERMPQLGVRVLGTAGQPALLTLDEQPFTNEPGRLSPVDPGQHVLLGTYQAQTIRVVVDLGMGERRELVLAFSAAAASGRPPASSDSAQAWRTAGWVGIGAGGATLLMGFITLAVAHSRYDQLQRERGCTRATCPAEARERIDSYNSLRSLSLLTTISGAVLGTAGAGVLLLIAKETPPVSLALSAGALTVSGQF